MQIFLPSQLSPQGWLSDVLLPQLYAGGAQSTALRQKLYLDGEDFESTKIVNLHPAFSNELMTKKMQKVNSTNQKKIAAAKLFLTIKEQYLHVWRNMKPHQLAALQPYMKMHKLTKPNRNKKASWKDATESQIIFEPFTDISRMTATDKKTTKSTFLGYGSFDTEENILKNKFERGAGAGIMDLSVKRDFPVWGLGASFYADINFFFASFGVFAKGHPVRTTLVGEQLTKADDYVTLIKPNLDPEIETLVLEYGYSTNPHLSADFWGPNVTKGMIESFIEQEKKIFHIKWTKHDISFTETGEVKLSVKYIGLPESMAYARSEPKKESNIFKPYNLNIIKKSTKDKKVINEFKKIDELKKELDKKVKACMDKKATGEEEAEFKKEIKGSRAKIKRLSFELEKIKREHAKKTSALLLTQIARNGSLFGIDFRSEWHGVAPGRTHKISSAIYRVPAEDWHTNLSAYSTKMAKAGKMPAPFVWKQQQIVERLYSGYRVDDLKETKKRVKYDGAAASAEESVDESLDRILAALTYSTYGSSEDDTPARIFVLAGAELKILVKAIKDPVTKKCPKDYSETQDTTYECQKTITKKSGSKAEKCPSGYDAKGLQTINKKKHTICHLRRKPTGGEGRSNNAHTFGNFMFFPLRSLIKAIYDWSKPAGGAIAVADDDRYSRLPITSLGNVSYQPLGTPVWVNIGDILVETGVFKRWFYNEVTAKKTGEWTFGQFMESVTQTLVPTILSGHSLDGQNGSMVSGLVATPFKISEKAAKKYTANRRLYATPKGVPESAATILALNSDLTDYALDLKSNRKKDNAISVLHFHQRTTVKTIDTGFNTPMLKKTEDRKFNREKDEKDGMIHLFIGASSGPLETITFSYSDNQDLRTALVYDKYKDVAHPYLKFAYSAQPATSGNNLFYKAGYFVLPVSPLGISLTDDPGITGYYSIQSLTDTLSPGVYKTTIQGINVHSPALKASEIKKRAKECGIAKDAKEEEKPFRTSFTPEIDKYVYENLLSNTSIAKKYKLKIEEKQ
tara:strand:- start:78 stop:3152 length:3075 start_codon:yes stop_codon:yes gene_type:complete